MMKIDSNNRHINFTPGKGTGAGGDLSIIWAEIIDL